MVTRVTKQITLTNESATEKMRGALLFFCIFSLLLHVSQCERQTQGVCEGMRCQPTHRLTANPKHVPTSNGCGNAFFKVSNEFNFTPCCDSHDICYDTCGNKKDVCDREFTTCLANYCKTHPNAQQCHGQIQIYTMGVQVFGCQSYQTSQRNACICEPSEEL